MQFKHPELLYALFLLLIPIIIHLFQLRRFQKIDFTNVAFLKKVTIQTRKSSQLKKWLTLLTRLLALACLILAFAQPFTASKTALNTKKENVIYIDNSFSMQAKGAEGPLLQRALQQLFEQSSGIENVSWFTNNHSKKNVSIQDFKNEILSVDYVAKQLSPEEILLKANQLFTNEPGSEKRLILISDFQQKGLFPEIPDDLIVDAVKLEPIAANNIAIDTVYIQNKNSANTELKVTISSQGDRPSTVPVSLYNQETLIAKTAVDFSDGAQKQISFNIENPSGFKGRLSINESNITFDNTLYFSINTPSKIKVLSINDENSNFLQRLFDHPEFDYNQQSFQSLNYNDIPTQNFVVLNELQEIPASLTSALKSFSDQGGSVFIIPSSNAELTGYNALLTSLGIGSITDHVTQEKKITQIMFSHPLYKDVFEKEVVNFQYPKVNSYYTINANTSSALRFDDGKPFVLQQGKNYFSAAAINSENSNFKNSPLIVPTLLNMALLSLPLPELYYTSGEQNSYSIPVKLIQDEILTLKDSTSSFIPLQQTKANQVLITTNDEPSNSGIYSIEKDNVEIEHISYNFSRLESRLQYANTDDWAGVVVSDNLEEIFESIAEENTINSFWKWFVIFAVLFLILEMLILKFYK